MLGACLTPRRRKALIIGSLMLMTACVVAVVLGIALTGPASKKDTELSTPDMNGNDGGVVIRGVVILLQNTTKPSPFPTTATPTNAPSRQPISSLPSLLPTSSPTEKSSSRPTVSVEPSIFPSFALSSNPTLTTLPSRSLSDRPSFPPTVSQEPSVSPTTITRRDVRKILQFAALQGGDEFVKNATTAYQFQSLEWVVSSALGLNSDELSDARIVQRYVLGCIYYATYRVPHTYSLDPPPWINSTHWPPTPSTRSPESVYVHECDGWYGVMCATTQDGDRVVTGLDLRANKLSGSLPPEIILLKQSLVTLKLGKNDLVNYGKEGNAFLGQLTALEHLSVGQTYFENDGIPTEIGLLTNLVTYEADSNSYDGPLKGETFTNLQKLTSLIIGGNSYNSPVPTQIANLPLLTTFHVENSNVTGDLNYLTSMVSLQSHVMHSNALKGAIPSKLAALTSLVQLSLSSNELTGTIPVDIFGTMKGLNVLKLENNYFTGNMPDDVCELTKLFLKVLSADCDLEQSSLYAVNCICCTSCF